VNIDTFVEDTQRIIIERKEREAREQRDNELVKLLRPENETNPD